MKQVARNLTDGLDGFLTGCRYLIHDRSSLFSPEFAMILESGGIKAVRLPARSPNLNAYAERYVRTIKEACLNRMILIGGGSLRRAISEFVIHYHTERNHQSLGHKIIHPEFAAFPPAGEVHCRNRLGGMLLCYYRQAA